MFLVISFSMPSLELLIKHKEESEPERIYIKNDNPFLVSCEIRLELYNTFVFSNSKVVKVYVLSMYHIESHDIWIIVNLFNWFSGKIMKMKMRKRKHTWMDDNQSEINVIIVVCFSLKRSDIVRPFTAPSVYDSTTPIEYKKSERESSHIPESEVCAILIKWCYWSIYSHKYV